MRNLIELEGRKKFGPQIDDIRFVISAMGDKRYVRTSHIMVSKGMMVGTDCARLHECKCPVEDCRPGLYRVLKSCKNHVVLIRTGLKIKWNFPKYKNLFRKKTIGWVEIARVIPLGRVLDSDFLTPLRGPKWNVRICKDMVIFERPEKRAVIMMAKS